MPRAEQITLHLHEQLDEDIQRLMSVDGATSKNAYVTGLIEQSIYGRTRTLNLFRPAPHVTHQDDAD